MNNLIKASLMSVLLATSFNASANDVPPIKMEHKEFLCEVISQTTYKVNEAFHSMGNTEFKMFIDDSIIEAGGDYRAYGMITYSAILVELDNDKDSSFVKYLNLTRCLRLMTPETLDKMNELDNDARLPAFIDYMVNDAKMD